MWYGYEKTQTGAWQPVVWHIDHPDKMYPMSTGKDNHPRRSDNIVKVPANCLDGEGNPLWGRLRELNPPPAPAIVKDAPIILNGEVLP